MLMISGMLRCVVFVTCLISFCEIVLVVLRVILSISLLRIRSMTVVGSCDLCSYVLIVTTVCPMTLVVAFRTGVPTVVCLVFVCVVRSPVWTLLRRSCWLNRALMKFRSCVRLCTVRTKLCMFGQWWKQALTHLRVRLCLTLSRCVRLRGFTLHTRLKPTVPVVWCRLVSIALGALLKILVVAVWRMLRLLWKVVSRFALLDRRVTTCSLTREQLVVIRIRLLLVTKVWWT